MATDKKDKNPTLGDAILGDGSKLIGTYTESYGGGTPLPSGQKAPSEEWVAEHRKLQPRDSNGQFTYNSANGHTLKYGPSRGVTIPPFLLGAKLTYAISNKSVIIGADDKRYLAGVNMTAKEIIDNYKNYINENGKGGFRNLQGELSRKKGRYSKEEKEAVSQKDIGILGGIKVKDMSKEYANKKTIVYNQKTNFTQEVSAQKNPTKKQKNINKKAGFYRKAQDKSNTPKYGNLGNNEFDLAKNNPKDFINKYSSELVNLQKKLGKKLNTEKVVKNFIANGSVSSWNDLYDKIKSKIK